MNEASSLRTAVNEAEIPLHLALSNTETTIDEVRAVFDSAELPPSTVCKCVDRAIVAVDDHSHSQLNERPVSPSDAPVGVQVVIDLDTARILYAFGYATVPKPGSRSVVDSVREFGYTPHVVSGDATGILDRVGEELEIPSSNLHPYQSVLDKATVVNQFADETYTVMVGDYVNDRLAFQEANLSIFIDNNRDDGGKTTEMLTPLADHVVDSIEQVPELLSEPA
ncbi:hypothetical protein ACLI4Y_01910 [Natrialbaceae archaeon A-CW3]